MLLLLLCCQSENDVSRAIGEITCFLRCLSYGLDKSNLFVVVENAAFTAHLEEDQIMYRDVGNSLTISVNDSAMGVVVRLHSLELQSQAAFLWALSLRSV